MNKTITWGGFITENVRIFIIKSCIESGNALDMFRAIEDIVEDIRDEMIESNNYEEYWNSIKSNYLNGNK